jgi:hypothetical protein
MVYLQPWNYVLYSKTSLYEYEAHQLELRIFRGILIKNYVILQNQSVRHLEVYSYTPGCSYIGDSYSTVLLYAESPRGYADNQSRSILLQGHLKRSASLQRAEKAAQ